MVHSAAEQSLVRFVRAVFLPDGVDCILPNLSEAEWDAVATKAQKHRLAPLLYAALKARDLLRTLPEGVVQNLRAAYFRANIANWFAFQELGQLLDCFNRERLPVVLLKGCALAGTLYPDMTLRPMVDLDVLVPEAELSHIAKLLAGQGYFPFMEPGDGFQQTLRNEQAYAREGQIPIAVDVHWHLMAGKYYSTRIPIDWFWQRTTALTVGDRSALVLSPEPQLLHLVAHLVLHHSGEGLLWSFDIALLLERYRDRLRWDEVVKGARSFGLDQILRTAITQVHGTWGVTVSAEANNLLNGIRPSAATLLRSAIHGTHYDGARATWDALSTPGFRGKLIYLQVLVFPSEYYMQERYTISDRRLMPLYYGRRMLKGLYIFLRSLVSIAASALRVFTNQRDIRSGLGLGSAAERKPHLPIQPDERFVN